MKKGQFWALGLTGFFILASLWSLFPTFRFWTLPVEKRTEQPELEKKAMKLGLDLRGGMHIVMEVDKSKLNEAEKKDAVDRALEIIRNRIDRFGVTEPQIQKSGQDRIVVELPGVQEVERAKNLLGQTAQLEFKLLETTENTKVLLDRIDGLLAAAEARGRTPGKPSPADTGADIFGRPKTKTPAQDTAAKRAESATDIFGQKTKKDTTKDTTKTAEEPTTRPFSSLLEGLQFGYFQVVVDDVPTVKQILARPDVQNLIPPDDEFLWGSKTEIAGAQEFTFFYLTKKQVELSGKYLVNAQQAYGGGLVRSPIVNFKLTREGGAKFSRLTGANVSKPLAIILDGKVISAPEIKERIPRGEGQITMGSGSTLDDASDLAIILRAGALPAPVRIIESNVIGPSLGADSIQKGKLSFLIGMGLVLLFMAIYYKLSGVIADVALILNFLFLMGAMAGLRATLTMPGIAGIILTMGMSVDSNVLIFERIREEFRGGKTIRVAIDAGYRRALLTVVDSHVTTLITAAVLFMFGTGPVKGFAVSLSLGVSISLYTAVVVTRVIFDIRKQYHTLSI